MVLECQNTGCKSKGSIEIDESSSLLTCGVVGITSVKNVSIVNGIVTCATCGFTIHEQK